MNWLIAIAIFFNFGCEENSLTEDSSTFTEAERPDSTGLTELTVDATSGKASVSLVDYDQVKIRFKINDQDAVGSHIDFSATGQEGLDRLVLEVGQNSELPAEYQSGTVVASFKLSADSRKFSEGDSVGGQASVKFSIIASTDSQSKNSPPFFVVKKNGVFSDGALSQNPSRTSRYDLKLGISSFPMEVYLIEHAPEPVSGIAQQAYSNTTSPSAHSTDGSDTENNTSTKSHLYIKPSKASAGFGDELICGYFESTAQTIPPSRIVVERSLDGSTGWQQKESVQTAGLPQDSTQHQIDATDVGQFFRCRGIYASGDATSNSYHYQNTAPEIYINCPTETLVDPGSAPELTCSIEYIDQQTPEPEISVESDCGTSASYQFSKNLINSKNEYLIKLGAVYSSCSINLSVSDGTSGATNHSHAIGVNKIGATTIAGTRLDDQCRLELSLTTAAASSASSDQLNLSGSTVGPTTTGSVNLAPDSSSHSSEQNTITTVQLYDVSTYILNHHSWELSPQVSLGSITNQLSQVISLDYRASQKAGSGESGDYVSGEMPKTAAGTAAIAADFDGCRTDCTVGHSKIKMSEGIFYGDMGGALNKDGELLLWGASSHPILTSYGYTSGRSQPTPVKVTDLGSSIIDFDINDGLLCVVKSSDHNIYCRGIAKAGVFSDQDFEEETVVTHNSWQKVCGSSGESSPICANRVHQISIGSDHGCAVLFNRQLACWGIQDESTPRLGSGDAAATRDSVYVSDGATSLSAAKELIVNKDVSMALDTNGKLWVWGSSLELMAPTGSASSGHATKIWEGSSFDYFDQTGSTACAITVTGHLDCWGSGDFGFYGPWVSSPTAFRSIRDNGMSSELVRIKVSDTAALGSLSRIDIGQHNIVAITNQSKILGWGTNYSGTLSAENLDDSIDVPQFLTNEQGSKNLSLIRAAAYTKSNLCMISGNVINCTGDIRTGLTKTYYGNANDYVSAPFNGSCLSVGGSCQIFTGSSCIDYAVAD